jgi:hypothetical protein
MNNPFEIPKCKLQSYISSPSPARPVGSTRRSTKAAEKSGKLCLASSFFDPALQFFTGHSVVAYYVAINTIYGGIHHLFFNIWARWAKFVVIVVSRVKVPLPELIKAISTLNLTLIRSSSPFHSSRDRIGQFRIVD